MIKKLNILFTKKQINKLYLILFASIFATFFEVIGIGSIPVFAMLIIDVESFINNLSLYISVDFLNEIDRKNLKITGASLLVSIFIFKNLYDWFGVHQSTKWELLKKMKKANLIDYIPRGSGHLPRVRIVLPEKNLN